VRIGLLPLLLVRVAIVFIIRDPAGILRRQRQVQFLVILVIDSFGSVIGHDQRYQGASCETTSGLFGSHVLSRTTGAMGVPAVFTVGLVIF